MPSPREVALKENDRSKFEAEPSADAGESVPGASGEPRERDVSPSFTNPADAEALPATKLTRK